MVLRFKAEGCIGACDRDKLYKGPGVGACTYRTIDRTTV